MSYTTNPTSNRLGYNLGWKNTLLPQTTNTDNYQHLYLKSYLVLTEILKFYQLEVCSFEIKNLHNYKKLIHIFIYNPKPYTSLLKAPILEMLRSEEEDLMKIFNYTMSHRYYLNYFRSKQVVKKPSRKITNWRKRASRIFCHRLFLTTLLNQVKRTMKQPKRSASNINLTKFKFINNWFEINNPPLNGKRLVKKRRHQWLRTKLYARLIFIKHTLEQLRKKWSVGVTSHQLLQLTAWQYIYRYLLNQKTSPIFKRNQMPDQIWKPAKLLITKDKNFWQQKMKIPKLMLVPVWKWKRRLKKWKKIKETKLARNPLLKRIAKRFLSQIRTKKKTFNRTKFGKVRRLIQGFAKRGHRRPFQPFFYLNEFRSKRKIRKSFFKLTRLSNKLWRQKRARRQKRKVVMRTSKMLRRRWQIFSHKTTYYKNYLWPELLKKLKFLHYSKRDHKNWYLRRRFSNRIDAKLKQRWKLFKARKRVTLLKKQNLLSHILDHSNQTLKITMKDKISRRKKFGLSKKYFINNTFRNTVYLTHKQNMITKRTIKPEVHESIRSKFLVLRRYINKKFKLKLRKNRKYSLKRKISRRRTKLFLKNKLFKVRNMLKARKNRKKKYVKSVNKSRKFNWWVRPSIVKEPIGLDKSFQTRELLFSLQRFRYKHAQKLKRFKSFFPPRKNIYVTPLDLINKERKKYQVKQKNIRSLHEFTTSKHLQNQDQLDLGSTNELFSRTEQDFKFHRLIKHKLTKQSIYHKVIIKKLSLYIETFLQHKFNLASVVLMTFPYRTIYVPSSKLLQKLRFRYLMRRYTKWKFFDRLILLCLYNNKVFSNAQILADLIAHEIATNEKKPKQIINAINGLFQIICPSYIKTFKIVLTGKTKGRSTRLRGVKYILKRKGLEVIPAQTFKLNIAYAIGIAKTNKGLYSVKLWLQYL